jgi:hypothetical protein
MPLTDEEKLELVTTVLIRQIGKRDGHYRGNSSGPVLDKDVKVMERLKTKNLMLHDEFWNDAAAVLEALERAGA